MNLFDFDHGGIYVITNLINQKKYYGQTSCLLRRCSQHLYLLKNSKHFCLSLQTDFNIYGLTQFSFSIVQVESHFQTRLKLEQRFMTTIPNHLLYNENTMSNFKLKPRVAQKVKVRGKTYVSIADASRQLKESPRTVRQRLDDVSNTNYKRLEYQRNIYFDEYIVFIDSNYFSSTRAVVEKGFAQTTRQVRDRCRSKSKKWSKWSMRKKRSNDYSVRK